MPGFAGRVHERSCRVTRGDWDGIITLMRCFILIALGLLACMPATTYAEDAAGRRPDRFAIIFNMGYAGDAFPKDGAEFETLVKALKQAHYNTVLCQYEPWRAEICRKHGMRMMVDLLTPPHHVYKNVDGAKALCAQLADTDVVYAYHLWSDRIGGTAAGRSRDAANVRSWDRKHPVYVGSYNGRALADVENTDLFGFYDFHWRRGGLWRHLIRTSDAAQKHDAYFLRYAQGNPGLVEKGNYNRALYTLSVSLVFGMKGYMYHYTGAEIDKNTWQWQQLGKDLARVNARIAPLNAELIRIGNPTAVFSTPMTKTAKDDPIESDKPYIPPELKAVPADYWVQVEAGEALMGVFNDGNKTALLFANHNAYQTQEMRLRFKQVPRKVARFERADQTWQELDSKDGSVQFEIAPADVELLRAQTLP